MEFISIPIALGAGLFSILSPCVLPLVPVVLGAAVAENKYGPAVLAAGLAVSFTSIGMFVATIGYAIGLDGDVFRSVAAFLLVLVGAVLLMPRWQAQVALAAGPIGIGPSRNLGTCRVKAFGGNSESACCSGPFGAHVSGQH